MTRAAAQQALLARAAQELPEPGDPRRLCADLAAAVRDGADGVVALAILTRTVTAWAQLRDLSQERRWQSGVGWHLGRNLVLYAVLVLLAVLVLRPPPGLAEAALLGAGLYFLLVSLLLPLRLRRQRRVRAAVLAAYGADLSACLAEHQSGLHGRADPSAPEAGTRRGA